MPAKDLNAKQRCLLGLTLVAILATVMFLSSPLMVAMGVTLAALALLVVYIVFNLSVHWVDGPRPLIIAKHKIATRPVSIVIVCHYLLCPKALYFSGKVTRWNGVTLPQNVTLESN